MKRVRTKAGFELDVEDDVKVGDVIPITPETPEELEVDDKVVAFMAHVYGLQKEELPTFTVKVPG